MFRRRREPNAPPLRLIPVTMTLTARTALAVALTAAGVVSGCTGSSSSTGGGTPPSTRPPSPSASPTAFAADCPKVANAGKGSPQSIIDYVDFVQAFGRPYVAGLGRNVKPASRSDLGPVVLRSRCSFSALNDRTHANPGPARDGDTGFLPPGTPIHALDGWPQRCRLAAVHDGRVVVYLAYRPDSEHARPAACAMRHGDGDTTEG